MKATHSFRTPRFGIEHLPGGYAPPRHQHCEAYATVLLQGAFEQCSYAGRMRVGAGDVLIQPTLDCHADRMLTAGLIVLRLPWPREEGYGGVYAGCDADLLARLAIRDAGEAMATLREQIVGRRAVTALLEDAADSLAGALTAGTDGVTISGWAEQNGLARETLSRGFGRLYGVSPSRFRAELRARSAWLRITGGCEPLATIASDCGFADQPHMTRAVRQWTGATPAFWRHRSHSFKTGTSDCATLPA